MAAKSLARGARGPEVTRLQRALARRGFPPGKADGSFGAATEAALIAFQRSEALLADGVAGQRTLHALELADDPALPSALPRFTLAKVCSMFPSTPRANVRKYLPPVLQALAEDKLGDKLMVLAALATIRAETEAFVPVAEGRSRFNSSPGGTPFDLYDRRQDLGNTGPPDGERYCGRGFVQLTGRANYRRYGQLLGLSLLEEPELANEPESAARILARFLAERERAIKEALVAGDLRAARRLVNGGSHGLERFTDAYRIGAAMFT